MRIHVRNGGIPWWIFVGGLGFLIFGGWKGFFGAIAGVILIPIILLFTFALGFLLWSIYLAKKYGKQNRPSPFAFEREAESQQRASANREDVIVTDSVVIKSEEEDH